MHIYIYSFFRLFSYIAYYRGSSRVPCAIQSVLVDYFIYSGVYLLIPAS